MKVARARAQLLKGPAAGGEEEEEAMEGDQMVRAGSSHLLNLPMVEKLVCLLVRWTVCRWIRRVCYVCMCVCMLQYSKAKHRLCGSILNLCHINESGFIHH